MVRVFANGLGDLDSIPGQVISKTQKMASEVREAIQGKEWCPPLHLSVVAIKKGAFRLPSTMVSQLTYFLYIHTFGYRVSML